MCCAPPLSIVLKAACLTEPKLYHSPFPVSQAYDDPSTFGFSIGGTVISETLGMLHVKVRRACSLGALCVSTEANNADSVLDQILRITGLHKSGLFSSHSHVAIKLQLGQSISRSGQVPCFVFHNPKVYGIVQQLRRL